MSTKAGNIAANAKKEGIGKRFLRGVLFGSTAGVFGRGGGGGSDADRAAAIYNQEIADRGGREHELKKMNLQEKIDTNKFGRDEQGKSNDLRRTEAAKNGDFRRSETAKETASRLTLVDSMRRQDDLEHAVGLANNNRIGTISGTADGGFTVSGSRRGTPAPRTRAGSASSTITPPASTVSKGKQFGGNVAAPSSGSMDSNFP